MPSAAAVLGNPKAVDFLTERGFAGPKTAFILGSGWGHFIDSTEVVEACPYEEIPEFGASTVAGHAGRLVRGRVQIGGGAGDGSAAADESYDYLAMQGRMHRYEGHPLSRIGDAVAVLAGLGVRDLVVTCAAGGVNPSYSVGDLVLVHDYLNFMFESPVRGATPPVGSRSGTSPRLVDLAERAASAADIPLHRGVLCSSKGPTYETPAEVRMIATLGGDVASMSTAPELIAAASLGLDAVAFACVTNMAPGVIPGAEVTHDEVIEVMQASRAKFSTLLAALLQAFETHRPAAG